MTIPTEMISGPLTAYVADPGTAMPEISLDPPAATWTVLGKNIRTDGVTFSPSETINRKKTLDSPMTKKLFRSEFDLDGSLTLDDLRAETFARIHNGAPVTTVAAGSGTGGYKRMVGGLGFNVTYYALLFDGISPYNSAMAMRLLVPQAYVHWNGGPEFGHNEDAAGLEVMFICVYDEDLEGYFEYRVQDALPSS